ncbi:ATP-binding protein [Streptomyces sp. NPDC048507]|uniref:ATP-binding protein n=1 Tax=Streptomyces sp. NPDC048507 TaxID=3365560 RepID=UPI003715362A
MTPRSPSAPRSGTDLSCAEARDTVRGALAGLAAPAPWCEDVLTVATELVSNARRHGGGVTAFRVTADRGAVVIEVSDASPRPPVTEPWAPRVPGGFGWRLVNQLAATDVRVHTRGHGKTVSAVLTHGPAVR